MRAESVAVSISEQVVADLPAARWDYQADIDMMEVFLPGSAGRPGVADTVGEDLYVRYDVETGMPLSIIIHGVTSWLAAQQSRSLPPPEAPLDYAAARWHLARVLRASPELAARERIVT